MAELESGDEQFTTEDLIELSGLVAALWSDAAELDWTRPAGTLDWSCLHTADHAVDCVYAPTFFLASRRQDRYPETGADVTAGDAATPTLLVESLGIATRLLVAVIRDAEPDARAIIFRRPEPTVGKPADFSPRGALELALHAHDVCSGLGVAFEPPAGPSLRLREHVRPWPFWGGGWGTLAASDDPWGDLLAASGRSRQG